MSYFRELPNILYQSNLLHKTSSREYVAVKNLFRKVKIQDWIEDSVNFFNDYTILDGQRPDNLAEIMYGSSEFDWVVVLTSGITNIKDEWPLSNYDLYRYSEEKYGLTNLNAVHHHETIEVKDNRGRLILPGGQIVDSDFKIKTPFDASSTKFYISDPDIGGGGGDGATEYRGVNQEINPVTAVSNYQYETLKNELKRDIKLMKPMYLQLFLQNMRTLMSYEDSSVTVSPSLIYTGRTRLVGP
jgi:hypothetical protein|tara:strand:+ start:844 stop:1572 length:729 start_codon:yes stop_codon:yes gene_type:complete